MADEIIRYIKKIQLTDGSVYYIYDSGAARSTDLDNYLPKNGGTITGNLSVDQKIIANNLAILTIEEIAEAYEIDNVLTQASNGDIKKRDTDYLLKDIGGCSYSMDDSSGILSLKLGK